ncbi:TPA: hypothetical protein HA238_01325 [Candidatus Micrarchaeota archaeon]|nr:hypothetical protein [Candidatus Micrarchaeota archaeon]
MKLRMMSTRTKQAIGRVALAATVMAETIAGPIIGKIMYDKEAAEQGRRQQISMGCKGDNCYEIDLGMFVGGVYEMILLDSIQTVGMGTRSEKDPKKAFAQAEEGFRLLEEGETTKGIALMLPYIHAIHTNAFGYGAPAIARLAIMPEYEFKELKSRLEMSRNGLDGAEAFYIPERRTMYMYPMEDLETTLSVIFHELGHDNDTLEGREISEFTSETMGFYLDLVSCRERIRMSSDTGIVEGEIYLDKDGEPILLKPSVCRRIPEWILENWVAYMLLKNGLDESHALGKVNAMLEVYETGDMRSALDAVTTTKPQDSRDRVIGEIVHMEAPEFYEKMLVVSELVMDFIYPEGTGGEENKFVQSFSFACGTHETHDNNEIIRYFQEYSPRGSKLTTMEFLRRSLIDANETSFVYFSSDGLGAPLRGISCRVGFITEGEIRVGEVKSNSRVELSSQQSP